MDERVENGDAKNTASELVNAVRGETVGGHPLYGNLSLRELVGLQDFIPRGFASPLAQLVEHTSEVTT